MAPSDIAMATTVKGVHYTNFNQKQEVISDNLHVINIITFERAVDQAFTRINIPLIVNN